MDDSQPRQQQNRSRNRLTADGQTSRRPRAVAGQRAASKRAAQPVQRSRAGQVIDPVRDDDVEITTDTGIDTGIGTGAGITAAPTLPEPHEPTEPVEPKPASTKRAEPTESTESEAGSDAETGSEDASASASADPERSTSAARKTRTTSGTRTTRPARRAIVTAVLAVALIAAVAIGAVFAVQYRTAIRTDHARTAAIAAAERAAPVIFSYDYRHLDQDFGKAETYLTGAFRSQYAKTTQTVVKPTATQYHGVVKATVAKPGDGSAAAVSVVSATPDQVVVLAFIDQSTTSTRVTGTQVDQNRVLLTLTHTSQGWLVSAVDAL